MANTSSAKKAIRVSGRKAAINAKVRTHMKSLMKKTRTLATEGKTKEAEAEFQKATSAIDSAAKKNVIHKNTAARYKSRLAIFIAKANT
ncbi:30S ribosomal protein S20 [Candidatus Dojkabacteria bacterium]|uniref:Small ribosomal subunit protein bS20 n=1 Tax=Candidatus Dojkabacteria bacterium TaxID=2099670 RepID=A0A955L3B4_9BACT|nr:30S ribosomal protein S20 [Candidatus Dojkabacteria bacterium]